MYVRRNYFPVLSSIKLLVPVAFCRRDRYNYVKYIRRAFLWKFSQHSFGGALMKGKKLLSWVLTAALCLSMSVGSAMAASFPDADASGVWAVPFIEDVVKKGIFIGIDGKFVPGRPITTSEVLTTCARIAVDEATRTEIAADRAAQMKTLIGEDLSWFRNSAAVCVEAGIVSYTELKELYQTKALTMNITKEDFSRYLVRAMQLEPMARNMTGYTLEFTDKKDITSGLEPYIYVLSMYGIVGGTDTGAFQPKSTVTRAVASKMLSVATDVMEENGTNVELPEYTDYYDWDSGTIISATAGNKGVIVLTVANGMTGTKSISLPAETPIYQNSMLADETWLKAGAYARVNLDSSGAAISVRLSGSVKSYTGNVAAINDEAVMLSVNGTTTTLNYDRFTDVKIGTKIGDRSLIDVDAGYTGATCVVDQLGHMVTLELTGGTREEVGLISSAEDIATGGANIVVSGFDGQLQRFTIPSGTAVTVNGLPASTLTSYKGSYVTLRVSNDNASNVISAAVDSSTKYVQGAIKGTGTDGDAKTVTLTDISTGKATTYKVSEKAAYTYQDAPTTYGALQKDYFVTVRILANELDTLWAYPGSSVTEGIVTGISFPTGTTKEIISVTKADGAVSNFEFDLSNKDSLPEIVRNGKSATIDKLRSGDVVKVTSRYNAVTRIDSTPQSANLTGTIKEKVETTTGVTITVEVDNNGGTKTYTVTSDVSVTRDGGKTTISMYDLRVGNHVAMVTSGDQMVSIDVDKTASTSNQLSGTIIYVNTSDKVITFRADDGTAGGKMVMVSVPSGTMIQDVSGGGSSSVTLSKLQTGDTLEIYGSYSGDQFKANLIIKK